MEARENLGNREEELRASQVQHQHAVDELEASNQERDASRSEARRLRRELSDGKEEIEGLKDDNKVLEAKQAAAEARIAGGQATIAALEAQVQTLKNRRKRPVEDLSSPRERPQDPKRTRPLRGADTVGGSHGHESEEDQGEGSSRRPLRQQTPPGPGQRSNIGSTTGSGLDPEGLATASEDLKNIWRQLQFADGWEVADSEFLFKIFQDHIGKSEIKTRPQPSLDRSATYPTCLTGIMKKRGSQWGERDDAAPCVYCVAQRKLCVRTSWAGGVAPATEYDQDSAGKRWILEKRT